MRTIMLLFLLFAGTIGYSQSFFKNTKTLVTWHTGDNVPQSSKLKNGGLLHVKFDGTQVNVQIVFGTKGYSVDYFEESADWETMQLAEYDFDKDGKNELVIAYGIPDQLVFKIQIYKITKSGAREIGSFEGQSCCWFEKNKVKLPFGSEGLYWEYTLLKDKFLRTN